MRHHHCKDDHSLPWSDDTRFDLCRDDVLLTLQYMIRGGFFFLAA